MSNTIEPSGMLHDGRPFVVTATKTVSVQQRHNVVCPLCNTQVNLLSADFLSGPTAHQASGMRTGNNAYGDFSVRCQGHQCGALLNVVLPLEWEQVSAAVGA